MTEFKNRFTMKEVEDFWDTVAQTHVYEQANIKVRNVHTQRFYESIKHLKLTPRMKILNIWSRTGEAIPHLREKCSNIILINAELSGKMIEIAKRNFPKEHFVQVSLHRLPFSNHYFDYVLSLETLEHVPDPLLFLEEVRRVLKPIGKLVMSVPPAILNFIPYIMKFLKLHHSEGPFKNQSSRNVKLMLGEAGLKLVLHKGTVFFPFSNSIAKRLNRLLERKLQKSFLKELGIRQFYICEISDLDDFH